MMVCKDSLDDDDDDDAISWLGQMALNALKSHKLRYYATTILWPFVRDYPGEPLPEEAFTHSHIS